MAWSTVLLGAFLSLCVLILGVPAASASFPAYNGGSFPTIHSPSDPEEFSWEVTLGQTQELRGIDEHEIGVYFSNGQRAGTIEAEPASDAVGATVPTTIQTTGENVVTLTVHHREGNPAAGGAPFNYPVVDGQGWEGGFHTEVVVVGTSDERPQREQRERQEQAAREEREAAKRAARCHVPALRGVTLAGARMRLRRANCRLGAITKSGGVTAGSGRVIGQTAKPGSSLTHDARVGVKLGPGGGPPQS